MSYMRPNASAILTSMSGKNRYGKAVEGTPREIQVGVVYAKTGEQHTTVRADASASRGFADETVNDCRLLIPLTVTVKLGDKIELAGMAFRVTSVQPRYSVWGPLDHFQVDGVIWA